MSWGLPETLTFLLGTPQVVLTVWLTVHLRRQTAKVKQVLADESGQS